MRKLAFLLIAMALITGLMGADDAEAGKRKRSMPEFDLRVVTHNVAGGAQNKNDPIAVAPVQSQVKYFDPHIIMLQELCTDQYNAFLAANPTWNGFYSHKRESHPGCGVGQMGEALLSPYPMTNMVRHYLAPTAYSRESTMLCASVHIPQKTVTACTVHLMPGGMDEDRSLRTEASMNIEKILNPKVRAGETVVLGGDFNMGPRNPILDRIYNVDGYGKFEELDQTHTGKIKRNAAGHKAHGLGKLDYLFIAGTGLGHRAVSATVTPTEFSDHAVYRGTARVLL